MGKAMFYKIQGAFQSLGIVLKKSDTLYEFEYEHLPIYLSIADKESRFAFLAGVADSGYGKMDRQKFETALDVTGEFHKGYSGDWNDGVPYIASPEYTHRGAEDLASEWLDKELKAFFDAYMFLEANIHILCDPKMFGLEPEDKAASGVMTEEELETMIMMDFIAEPGIINIDAQDIKKLRDASDFLDGCRKECPAKEIKRNLQSTLNELKTAHSEAKLSRLAVNLLLNKESELLMEEMSAIHEVFDMLDDVEIIWGIGRNDNNKGNITICVVGGFKSTQ